MWGTQTLRRTSATNARCAPVAPRGSAQRSPIRSQPSSATALTVGPLISTIVNNSFSSFAGRRARAVAWRRCWWPTSGEIVVDGSYQSGSGPPREAACRTMSTVLTRMLTRPLVTCTPPTTANRQLPSVREFEGGMARLGRRVPLPRRAPTVRSTARQGKFGGPPRGLGRGGRIMPCQGAEWVSSSANGHQCQGWHWRIHRSAPLLYDGAWERTRPRRRSASSPLQMGPRLVVTSNGFQRQKKSQKSTF